MSRYKVYSKNGNTERCVLNKIEYNGSFMDERSVSASVESPTPINFEIYDYITYRGEKFELDYKPTSVKVSSKNSAGDAYRYELLFVSLKYELERCEMRDLVPYDNGIVYPTPLTIEFTGTAQKLAERVQACLDVMYSGSQKWTITVLPGASDEEKNISISQANCWSAVSLFNTEYGLNFYISGRTVTVGDVGTAIGFTFQYGKGKGLYKIERVSDTDQGIVTRLRAYGGTNNIGDNYLRDKTEWPDSVLPASMYLPNLMLPGFETTQVDYIESGTVSEYGIREGSVVYEDIYPSIVGMTNSKGDRIDKIKGAESITDDTASEFWITTYDLEFEKPLSDYIVTGGVPTIYIKSGQLQGYSFEINPEKIEEQSDGGYRIYLSRNTDNGYTVPNADVNLTAGTEFVFLGITMPKAYIESAENRLLARAQEYLGKYGKTNYGYEIGLDEIFAARDESIYNSLDEGKRLKVVDTDLGIDEEITIQSLTITEEDGGLPTYKITLNNEVSASTLNRIQGQVSQLESTVTNGFTLLKWQTEQYIRRFGRPYALWTRDGTSMWLYIDEDGSVATLVGSLYATKDVVAKSVDEEIEDAELPKAGYGITNFGLTAIKQGGGLMIDSNNLVYVDPAYAGGGGIDTGELEQYLTSHHYMKRNDPASYLLMTDYAMPETYAPVTSTDTVLTAIGKLERNFGNYVTIATQQTVTGKKTFTQDIIGQRDIICKSTSEAIADAELPIASATQLGLIKIGSGLSITADGVLSSTGGGGLTEVYWDDIKGKPSTFTPSSHTHTISQISNFPTYWDWDYISGKPSTFAPSYHTHTIANITDIGSASVLEASRLSNTRYFWGQPFNGQYDVDGSMSSVTNITMSGKLAVGVSSAQAKVHVNGDGLFTGDLICKSTSTAISDAELPIASASTLGLIKVGSGLKISNGVLSVSGGSGGGSDVRFGLYDDNYVTLLVDNSYYELSRRRHKHSVTTTGSGNAVTSISFGTDGGMTLTKGSTFSLYNHNHTVSNSGSGNAVTSISFSGGTLTATKGSTFSLNGHTHSQYITGLTRSTSGSGNVVTDVTVSGSRVTVYYGNASGSSTASSLATRVYTGGTTFSDGGTLGVYISGGNGIEGRNGASRDNLYLNYSSSSKHVKIDSNANLTCKGTIFYGNLSQDSDLRLKNVLGVLNGVLDLMSQIPVIEYQYKADENNINYYGFGAQSFIGRFRNIAALNDDHYTINTSGIVAIAFQGVKELYSLQKQTTNEIEVLKQRIALLEAENQNLWNIINEINEREAA